MTCEKYFSACGLSLLRKRSTRCTGHTLLSQKQASRKELFRSSLLAFHLFIFLRCGRELRRTGLRFSRCFAFADKGPPCPDTSPLVFSRQSFGAERPAAFGAAGAAVDTDAAVNLQTPLFPAARHFFLFARRFLLSPFMLCCAKHDFRPAAARRRMDRPVCFSRSGAFFSRALGIPKTASAAALQAAYPPAQSPLR